LGGKDELPLDIDLSGQYANRYGNIQAYSYNKPIGKIKDQKNSITKSSVYRIGQYSLNNSQFPEYTSSDSSINHHSSKYYFTYGRNQFVQIYEGCRTDDSEPIWTDSDLAEMKKDPNVPTDDKNMPVCFHIYWHIVRLNQYPTAIHPFLPICLMDFQI
jgi:hypothetical protein